MALFRGATGFCAVCDCGISLSIHILYLIIIDRPYSKQMIVRYPTELQFNKTNTFYKEYHFLNSDLSITNGIVLSKIYAKRDDFNF